MSGNTDPFLVLVDDIDALRRQIENLQRTSLDRDEAKHLNPHFPSKALISLS